ncbi:MAG TPA: hypothetical protein VLI65_06885 [Pyrinomonadaceae bacterium]|nr:hypothetical protein [Pyrinomonadaceae bacterium]
MAKSATHETNHSTTDKNVASTTAIGGLVLAIVVLIGILLMAAFYFWGASAGRESRISSENTATRPAEP